jgi:hypothetical protein
VIQKSWGNGILVFLVVFVLIPNLNCCIDVGGAKRGSHLNFIQVAPTMVFEYFYGILECPISNFLKRF